MTQKPEHVYSIFIQADPERIWDALTMGEFTRQYFHETRIQSTWEIGSPVTYENEDGSLAVSGEVMEVDRPRRLVFSWQFQYDPELAAEPHSRVSFDIEPKGEVCLLKIVHDQFIPESKTLQHIQGGWEAIMCALKTFLETGTAMPIPPKGT
ncbi:SRPBCC family protein [Sulfidibacter corallicola]|uniref:SRPBCC family protein n=1 Tax=Sulfidibacter corallicola TaxID=2818388 RepID=A0A8A4TPH9_SULCO|nr:SRPBCC family protein [Sulfidibacter corallicola]QTD50811.1 SRPBCC family protein [Sulfidibacter corallicola]